MGLVKAATCSTTQKDRHYNLRARAAKINKKALLDRQTGCQIIILMIHADGREN